MSVKVAKVFKVTIKDQELELSDKEVHSLYNALHDVLGKYPFVEKPKAPRKYVRGASVERILHFVEQCPKGADVQEIANLAEYSDRHVYQILHQLTEQRRVLRRRVGRKYIFFPLRKEDTPPSSVEALSAVQLKIFKGLRKIFDREERLRRDYTK